MRLPLILLLLSASVCFAAEPKSVTDPFRKEADESAAKYHRELAKAGFVNHLYKPQLLMDAAAAAAHQQDPVTEGKTPEQRQFLTEYYKILQEPDLLNKPPTYQFIESLRRCGVVFPEGARVAWLPFNPPLLVIHTPAGTRQIEKFMGLEHQKNKPLPR
jgi:hypothetical protein